MSAVSCFLALFGSLKTAGNRWESAGQQELLIANQTIDWQSSGVGGESGTEWLPQDV